MFVIEKLLDDHRTKVKAWEEARDTWVNGSSYRYRREYEDAHPRPGTWVKNSLQAVGIFLVIVGVVGVILSLCIGAKNDHKNHPSKKPATSSVQKKDVTYKVGDKVQVVFGDYKDSVGVIVKLDDDDAIIKLTNSTFTHAMADADDRNGGQDNGSLLSINSLGNLVPYKETK